MEVIRKLCLVANWLFFGGIGIFVSVAILADANMTLSFLVMIVFLILGLIVQKVINWVFQ